LELRFLLSVLYNLFYHLLYAIAYKVTIYIFFTTSNLNGTV